MVCPGYPRWAENEVEVLLLNFSLSSALIVLCSPGATPHSSCFQLPYTTKKTSWNKMHKISDTLPGEAGKKGETFNSFPLMEAKLVDDHPGGEGGSSCENCWNSMTRRDCNLPEH